MKISKFLKIHWFVTLSETYLFGQIHVTQKILGKLSKTYLPIKEEVFQKFAGLTWLSETYLISQIVFIYIWSKVSKTYFPIVQGVPSRTALSETYLSKISKIYLPDIQEVFLRPLRIALPETCLISQIVFTNILSKLPKTYLPIVQDVPSRTALSETYLPSKLKSTSQIHKKFFWELHYLKPIWLVR